MWALLASSAFGFSDAMGSLQRAKKIEVENPVQAQELFVKAFKEASVAKEEDLRVEAALGIVRLVDVLIAVDEESRRRQGILTKIAVRGSGSSNSEALLRYAILMAEEKDFEMGLQTVRKVPSIENTILSAKAPRWKYRLSQGLAALGNYAKSKSNKEEAVQLIGLALLGSFSPNIFSSLIELEVARPNKEGLLHLVEIRKKAPFFLTAEFLSEIVVRWPEEPELNLFLRSSTEMQSLALEGIPAIDSLANDLAEKSSVFRRIASEIRALKRETWNLQENPGDFIKRYPILTEGNQTKDLSNILSRMAMTPLRKGSQEQQLAIRRFAFLLGQHAPAYAYIYLPLLRQNHNQLDPSGRLLKETLNHLFDSKGNFCFSGAAPIIQATILNDLAEIVWQRKEFGEEVNANHPLYYWNKGIQCLELEKKRGLKVYRGAAVYYNAGRFYRSKGNNLRAIECYADALGGLGFANKDTFKTAERTRESVKKNQSVPDSDWEEIERAIATGLGLPVPAVK